ncbi:hypothetical protein CBER1_08792 [Cercospora berteroae]|uniref:DNA topoisomerase (ATP-hydrolyzing) n=1 Tax=Cercospora berteroae TaxID=357750 RepID=A0A2S6BWT3_9PEZI|nr:hypothetical protein CBER1_08792 [Cercospora berteroae]
MDSEDFEDLFGEEVTLLEPSSQGSLTDAAANLAIDHEDDARAPCNPMDKDDEMEDDNPTAYDLLPVNTGSFADTVRQNDFRPPQRLTQRAYPNAAVIDKIEAVFEEIADAMLHDKLEIGITLKTRPRTALLPRFNTSSNGDAAPTRRLCFPGKTADEAWRFFLRILELMHEALRNDVVISKRDIYYRDPALFGSQTQVDRYVDDIAFTFGITRATLNVSAAAKGLVAGAMTIRRKDDSTTSASSDQEGILVPTLKDILSIDMSHVKWILVIEKEATFRSIANSSLWEKIKATGIIITGKGYPDLSTRALLRFLSTPSSKNSFSSPPVFGLADFDPDGIGILSVYRHGSKALAHENENLVVPQLQWLGLRSEHLRIGDSDPHTTQGLLTLTKRDRAKAVKMLEQTGTEGDEDSALQRRELQTMLMLNVKAELQVLDAVPNGMTDLLESTLRRL